jgi:hypothetical protein
MPDHRSCPLFWLPLLLCGTLSVAAEPPPPAPLHGRIDALIDAKRLAAGLPAAGLCSDAEFVRRIHLDLAGMIPTAEQARVFLDDAAPDKRRRLIDSLLTSPDHAIHQARVFDVMLLERRTPSGGTTNDVPPAMWRDYLAEAFAENRPWDVMAREILGGDGTDEKRGAAVRFYLARDVNAHQLTRDVGRLFLGIDLQCAQCHDDTRFPDYRQADYYGLYAFLERSKLHPVKPKGAVLTETAAGTTKFTSVFTAKSAETAPRLPGDRMIADPPVAKDAEYRVKPAPNVRGIPAYSRREKLAEVLPRPETGAFAANLANRLWAQMLGRGLVNPLDLRHAGNPPSHPELLDVLATWLLDHGYDMRGLLREIALSNTYQRSSLLPEGASGLPEEVFAVAKLRGLSPEQFRWSVLQATGRIGMHLARLDAQPPKPDEAALPEWKLRLNRLEALDRPSAPLMTVLAGLPGQAESGFQPTVDQALHLMNSAKFMPLLGAEPGTTLAKLAAIPEPGTAAEELYLQVLSRRPAPEETAAVTATLSAAASPAERADALKPLLWGLLLSAEFRLNH